MNTQVSHQGEDVRGRNQAVLPRVLAEFGVSADFYDQGVAVNALRFRIAWGMVFVALAALDFTAIRAVFDYRGPTSYLLGIGAMPMANVLVVGLLVGHRRRGGRRFLIGFEAFGAMALGAYVVSSSLFAEELVIPYLRLVFTPFLLYLDNVTRMSLQSYLAIYYLILAVLLGLPLLAFGLIGGFFCRGLATAVDRTAIAIAQCAARSPNSSVGSQ
jgi:hypothetical protein